MHSTFRSSDEIQADTGLSHSSPTTTRQFVTSESPTYRPFSVEGLPELEHVPGRPFPESDHCDAAPFQPPPDITKFEQAVKSSEGRSRLSKVLIRAAHKLENDPNLKTQGYMSAYGETTIQNKSQIKHAYNQWNRFFEHIKTRYSRLLTNHRELIISEISKTQEFHQTPLINVKRRELLILGAVRLGISAAFLVAGTTFSAAGLFTAGTSAVIGATITFLGLALAFSTVAVIGSAFWSHRKIDAEPKAEQQAKKMAQEAGLVELKLGTAHLANTSSAAVKTRISKLHGICTDVSNELSHILKLYRSFYIEQQDFKLKGDLTKVFEYCIDLATTEGESPNTLDWNKFEDAFMERVTLRLQQLDEIMNSENKLNDVLMQEQHVTMPEPTSNLDATSKLEENNNTPHVDKEMTVSPNLIKPKLASHLWAAWLVSKTPILEKGLPIPIGSEIAKALGRYNILSSTENSDFSLTTLSEKDITYDSSVSCSRIVKQSLDAAVHSILFAIDRGKYKPTKRDAGQQNSPWRARRSNAQLENDKEVHANQVTLIEWARHHLEASTQKKPHIFQQFLSSIDTQQESGSHEFDTHLSNLMQYLIIENQFDTYLNRVCPTVMNEIQLAENDLPPALNKVLSPRSSSMLSETIKTDPTD